MEEKARGTNTWSARIWTSINVACCHGINLAFVITKISMTTSFLIAGIDTVLNLKLCYKIVKQYRNYGNVMTKEIKNKLETFVIKETLELIIPITYCLMISTAYYGPNADTLGNIKNGYWTYVKIADITVPLTKLGVFLLLDLLRILVSSIILWTFCRINMFAEYCQMISNYWVPIASVIGAYTIGVSRFKH
jgi:hypothetical protein